MDPNLTREPEDYRETGRDDSPIPDILEPGQIPRIISRRGFPDRPMRRAGVIPIQEILDTINRRRRAAALSSIAMPQNTEIQPPPVDPLTASRNPSTSFPGRGNDSPSPPPPSERRRTKRRKLGTEDTREGIRGFNYGHYGQVVSVPLKMEIASCDPDNSRAHLLARNVLLNDRSVYHPEGNRCNIILRHRGDIPFCLKKLVIRTPMTDSTSPSTVREGMVFVSMAMDEVFNRTAQYKLRYPDPITGQPDHDPAVQHYFDVIRSLLSSPERTFPHESDGRSQHVSTGGQRQQAFDFNATMEQDDKAEEESLDDDEDDDDDDDDDDDQQDQLSPSDLEDSVSERHLLSPDDPEESDDSLSDVVEALARHLDSSQQRLLESLGVAEPFMRIRSSQALREIRQIQPPTILSSHGGGDNAAEPSSSSSSVMKPHARFYVENEKNMVSIKFDPPASGRFILLKFWSPFSHGMEIQNVVAHGFAGPRYFPSVGFR